MMNSHLKFPIIYTLLRNLCTEKVKYVSETKSQITNIIPKPEFIQFMYHLKSLVIKLFEKHNELGPNILHYIKNSLLSNIYLNQLFVTVLKSSAQNINVKLNEEEYRFIYDRYISIYMKSRQKTWRGVNNYILKKGIASLRENLKVMHSNQPKTSNSENKKPTIIKKANLPSNPIYALE